MARVWNCHKNTHGPHVGNLAIADSESMRVITELPVTHRMAKRGHDFADNLPSLKFLLALENSRILVSSTQVQSYMSKAALEARF